MEFIVEEETARVESVSDSKLQRQTGDFLEQVASHEWQMGGFFALATGAAAS